MNDLDGFLKNADRFDVVPVVDTMPADLLTPLAVYLKLAVDAENSFLLESVEGGEALARYSFIGAEPEMIVTGNDQTITLSDLQGTREIAKPIIEFLRERLSKGKLAEGADLPSFIGGAIGFFDFSCSEWFEPTLKRTGQHKPDQSAFMFYRSFVAFDHAKQVIKIISLVFRDEAGDDFEAAFQTAAEANAKIRELLETGSLKLPRYDSGNYLSEAGSNFSKTEFEANVTKIKELITAGECYQVVLSQCFSKTTDASPISIYRAIRSLNPSPYMFLLRFGSKSIIGASPEMLVRCRGQKLEYRPIAGTRPRGKTATEDTELAAEMAADRKEVAEHLMLVDLGRNDLGRVAEYGTVKVSELMNVEKYSHVQHLVSYLSAELRDGADRFDALAACFPAGTVSGAPKVRAMEIIHDLEPTERGVYAGAVGYFDYAGNMDTCIAIRTLMLENGIATVQAGAGIVADSVPELEYEETVNKAKAMLRAVEIAERGNL